MINQLKELLGDDFLENEPMSLHTTFKIGGVCDYYLKPDRVDTLTKALKILHDALIPITFIGNGSNLLVLDGGIEGAVICTSYLKQLALEGETMLYAGSGAFLSEAAVFALEHNLTGLEFAHGIPGSVGGAVVMNAGAYGGEMKNVVHSADYVDETYEVQTIGIADMQLGYRTSIFQKAGSMVVGVRFALALGSPDAIREQMKTLAVSRRTKQPLDFPSAGSVFKRPEGYYTGKLIEDAGLKGYKIGGAQVSEKHSGFIINVGGATAKDVSDLIEHIKKTVRDKFGVELSTEIKVIGRPV
jgi:UDP-N-acetylmuramate dehydrogenase